LDFGRAARPVFAALPAGSGTAGAKLIAAAEKAPPTFPSAYPNNVPRSIV